MSESDLLCVDDGRFYVLVFTIPPEYTGDDSDDSDDSDAFELH